MDVPPRDLICRPLAALKDNRAEAVERELALVASGAANGAPAPSYRPGLYLMMDWVAARLHKAGAALWVFVLDGEEIECLSALAACFA
jgi:hypothetical protein